MWDEVAQSAGAGGGGISQVFKEPAYQTANLPASDQALLNGFRGIPDISYNADPLTFILVYLIVSSLLLVFTRSVAQARAHRNGLVSSQMPIRWRVTL